MVKWLMALALAGPVLLVEFGFARGLRKRVAALEAAEAEPEVHPPDLVADAAAAIPAAEEVIPEDPEERARRFVVYQACEEGALQWTTTDRSMVLAMTGQSHLSRALGGVPFVRGIQ